MADTSDYCENVKDLLADRWRGAGYYIAEPTIVVRADGLTWSETSRPFIMIKDAVELSYDDVGEDVAVATVEVFGECQIAFSGTGATDKKNLQNYYNEINYIVTNFTTGTTTAPTYIKHSEIGPYYRFIPSNRVFVGFEFSILLLVVRDYSS